MKKILLMTIVAFNVMTFNVNATPTLFTDMLSKFSNGSLWSWNTTNNVEQAENKNRDLFEEAGLQDLDQAEKESIKYFFEQIQDETPLTEKEKILFIKRAFRQNEGYYECEKNEEILKKYLLMFCECFPSVKRLTIVSKENDHIYLPNNIANLSSLERLSIEGPFSFEPGTLKKLENLKSLILAHNNFIELPEEVLELHSLKNLAVFSNTLSALPSTIGCLKNLNFFDMYYYGRNVIQLPRSFFKELADNSNVAMVSITLETIPYRLKKSGPEILSDFDTPAYLDAVAADPDKHISYGELKDLFGDKFDGNARV